MMIKVAYTRFIISSVVLAFALFLLVSLFFFDIPHSNKDLVNILLGAVIGWTGNIVSFYFGSTDKTGDKNDSTKL